MEEAQVSTVVDQAVEPRRRRRWKFRWLPFVASVIVLAGAALLLYPEVASWFSQREQSRVTELAQARLNQPPVNDPTYRSEMIDVAHQYNEALASGALLEANANIAVGDGTSSDDTLVYDEMLDATGTGFMGRLRYDALTIDLPIYHGTDDDTLLRGVGHLEGTSLPVGGVGTRSVLTAHRGLPEATLFNELDRAAVGDVFTVSVVDQVLSYQVIETRVIEPHETEAILADPTRDLLTLITCTPLGINSHRILVTAERITPTPIEEVQKAADPPEIPGFPWWAVILGGTVGLCGVYVWRSGYPPKPKAA